MKKIYIWILLVFWVFQGLSQNVSMETAAKVAGNWYRFYAPESKKLATIEGVREYKVQKSISFYIFTFNLGGFVIVPSNNQSDPVLGYGFESKIPGTLTNPTAKFWFDGYAEYVDSLNRHTTKSATMNSKWDDILNNRFLKSAQEVTPLLTTKWSQEWPYNIKCPADAAGSGGHTVTGCVATAMAQIMKYYNFPQKGFGYYSYYHAKYGQQTADFGATPYDWANMPDILDNSSTNAQKEAVGTLMYHLGVNVEMDFGTDGSTAKLGSFPFSMFEFFNYLQPTLIASTMYPITSLPDILRKELDAKRPVYYAAGHSSTGQRHALVCDGYQGTDFFHFNFGWGGTGDGFYYLNGTSQVMSFVKNYEAIINIQPDNGQNVRANTTWEGNVTIKGRVGVRSDATLTIKPGTSIKFGKDGGMVIYGNISAKGTAGAPIVFTAQDTLVGWNGIELNNALRTAANTDSSRFFNCEISHAKASYTTTTSMCGVYYWVTCGMMITKYSKLSIDSCKFTRNVGTSRGTALYFWHSSPRLSNSLITKNRGFHSSAILMSADTWEITSPVVEYNTISYNSGETNGAIVLEASVTPLIRNNKIIGNSALTGHAIYAYFDASPKIINNLIAENYGWYNNLPQSGEPAISLTNTNSVLANNTIANNRSKGIVLKETNTLTMKNNIMWGQQSDNIQINGNSTVSITHSDIQGGKEKIYISGTSTLNYENNISTDPGFLSSPSSYMQLMDTSPCINTGTPDLSNLALPAKDLAGNPRVYGGRIDMGVYENQTKVATPDLFFDKERVTLYSTISEIDSAVVKVTNINKVKMTGLTGLAAPFSAKLNNDSTQIVIKVNSATGGDFKDTLLVASTAGTKTIAIAAWVGKTASGEIWGIWTAPLVRVEGDIIVPNGKTLEIGPSTTVEFLGHFKLEVQGRLLAVGQANKLITFTGTKPVGWKGIRFSDTPATNDSSRIQFCILENGVNRGENLERDGGALYVRQFSKLTVSDCIIRNNDASGYSGGGIALENSASVYIRNCQIINNSALDGAGININLNSCPKIIGNHISGNSTILWGRGGGINVDNYSKPFIVNNVISKNLSTYGGGLRLSGLTVSTLFNNTIVDNLADRDGCGGLMINYQEHALIVNNIIYGNKIVDKSTGQAVFKKYLQVYFANSGDADLFNNDIQGGRDSIFVEGGYTLHGAYTDNINANPKFVTFQSEEYYPASSSPCVNKGKADVNAATLGTAVDLMGNPRFFGGKIDIGAFELQELVSVPEIKQSPGFTVYPNPSAGKFRLVLPDATMHSGNLQIEVINILGDMVLQKQYNDNKNLMEIDLSNRPKGVYLLRTLLGNKQYLGKIVIK